jgi:hypothetical protein
MIRIPIFMAAEENGPISTETQEASQPESEMAVIRGAVNMPEVVYRAISDGHPIDIRIKRVFVAH